MYYSFVELITLHKGSPREKTVKVETFREFTDVVGVNLTSCISEKSDSYKRLLVFTVEPYVTSLV